MLGLQSAGLPQRWQVMGMDPKFVFMGLLEHDIADDSHDVTSPDAYTSSPIHSVRGSDVAFAGGLNVRFRRSLNFGSGHEAAMRLERPLLQWR